MKGQVSEMSSKNVDGKNRWRNETIAFRVTHQEKEKVDRIAKLCGYQTKQEFILDAILSQQIKAVGNPLMLVSFRRELRHIIGYLERSEKDDETEEEMLMTAKAMLDILEAFAEESDA